MIYNPWDKPPQTNDISFASKEYAEEPMEETSQSEENPIASALAVINQQSLVIKKLTDMLGMAPTEKDYD